MRVPALAISRFSDDRLNVSVDLSIPLKSLEQPLRDSIRELRRGYQAVSDCLEQTMAECDTRGTELADCRRQLAEARRSLSECEKQLAERTRADGDLAHRYAALKKQVEARQTELSQANDRATHAQAEGAQSKQRLELQIEQNQQLRQQTERLQADAESARGELAQLRTQFTALAESAAEAVKLRGELADAKSLLARQQEQLAAAPADNTLSESLNQELAAERLQRQQLENELDVLRHRGAELTEALAEQKRAVADEREHWNEELRQLRRAVERQSEMLNQRAVQPPAGPPAGEPLPNRPTSNGQGADKVIGTVLEQFEMLQRNKIRKLANTSG